MMDPLGRITEGKDLIGKIRNTLAGFVGYVDRENRREADKTLREAVSRRYEDQWGRISAIQRQLIAGSQLEYVDDLEAAAIKMRTFADRIKTAAYGYAGFFDAVRINSDELARIYQHDLGLLENVEKVAHAVDNVESSVGGDALPAAIRNLVNLGQEAIDLFNRRDEVILSSSG